MIVLVSCRNGFVGRVNLSLMLDIQYFVDDMMCDMYVGVKMICDTDRELFFLCLYVH